eukprot:754245-Hanusia_phi.AAC.2
MAPQRLLLLGVVSAGDSDELGVVDLTRNHRLILLLDLSSSSSLPSNSSPPASSSSPRLPPPTLLLAHLAPSPGRRRRSPRGVSEHLSLRFLGLLLQPASNNNEEIVVIIINISIIIIIVIVISTSSSHPYHPDHRHVFQIITLTEVFFACTTAVNKRNQQQALVPGETQPSSHPSQRTVRTIRSGAPELQTFTSLKGAACLACCHASQHKSQLVHSSHLSFISNLPFILPSPSPSPLASIPHP